jgi:hypothetical protein
LELGFGRVGNRVEIGIRVCKLEIGLEIGIKVWKLELGFGSWK